MPFHVNNHACCAFLNSGYDFNMVSRIEIFTEILFTEGKGSLGYEEFISS